MKGTPASATKRERIGLLAANRFVVVFTQNHSFASSFPDKFPDRGSNLQGYRHSRQHAAVHNRDATGRRHGSGKSSDFPQ